MRNVVPTCVLFGGILLATAVPDAQSISDSTRPYDRRLRTTHQYSFEVPEYWGPLYRHEIRGIAVDMQRLYGVSVTPYIVLMPSMSQRLPHIALRPLGIRKLTVGQARFGLGLGLLDSEVGGVYTNGISPDVYRRLKFDIWDEPAGLYCEFLTGPRADISVSTFLFPMKRRWHEVTLTMMSSSGPDYRPVFQQLIRSLQFNPEQIYNRDVIVARQREVFVKNGLPLLIAAGLAFMLWYSRRDSSKKSKASG